MTSLFPLYLCSNSSPCSPCPLWYISWIKVEMSYAELHCKSNFSFLEGASHPDELVKRAAELGYSGLAMTDRNSVAGVVRAHVAAREVGLPLIIGAEVTPSDSGPALLWAMSREGYGRLCR